MAKVESVPLGDLAKIDRQAANSAEAQASGVYVSLEDMDAASGTVQVAASREPARSAKFRFTTSHVLYGKLRPYLGKVARPEMSGVCSTDILPILPGERLDRDYLFHFLRTPDFTARATQAAVGVNLPRVSPSVLSTFAIPLPPLDGQRRIAEILDKADALRAKRRAALAQLYTLTQSIFLDMFGDPATNPKGWPEVRIGDHSTKIGSGATPRGGEEAYKATGITLIRSMNVRDGTFLRDGLAFIDDEQAAHLEGVVVEADDVLLNITGASVARVCRAPADVLPARVNQHVAIIRPTATFNPLFLEQCLLSASTKERLLRIARAGATREAITKSAIEQFRVIRPPRDAQDQFAARARASASTHQQMRSALAELDSLFATLQHRALRSEL